MHAPDHPWALHSVFPFVAAGASVPLARGHVRQVLREWGGGLATLAPITAQIVSELVTNAVEASRAIQGVPPGRLALFSDGARVLVMVGDRSYHEPIRAPVDPAALRGRGLLLVEAFSTCWGWFPTGARGFAKIVWSEPADQAE